MKAGVVIFPGSNCDQDTIYTLSHTYRLNTVPLWHKDTGLQGCDIIFLPGGFSYGDYLRSGAVARFSPIMESVIKFPGTLRGPSFAGGADAEYSPEIHLQKRVYQS